jgi:hypothetical protein
MIAEPPVDDGGVNATVMLPLAAVAVPMVGAAGGSGVEDPPPPPPQAASNASETMTDSARSVVRIRRKSGGKPA